MNIEQQQAAFEAWLSKHCDYDDLNKSEIELANEAYLSALASPKVQALRDALQEVVDAADSDGWKQIDPSFQKQCAALATMEKQK